VSAGLLARVYHIQDNRAEVELRGLTGISVTSRGLFVISRSAGLAEENWRALTALQTERPQLTILAYDQLHDRHERTSSGFLGRYD
jgi:hypothetical protein